MATLRLGSGGDGAITVTSNKNINTDVVASARTYADGINYKVTSIGNDYVNISVAPDGIVAGDEVILINLYGYETTNVANAGNYEFFIVDSVASGVVNFTSNKTKNYGHDGGDSSISSHSVMIQRIPNYTTVDIQAGGIITCNGTSRGDGATNVGGLVCFRSNDTVTIAGRVDTIGKGPAGGVCGYDFADHGKGWGVGPGTGVDRYYASFHSQANGSGAGHSAVGAAAGGYPGGIIYGTTDIAKLHVGSGGGAASNYWGPMGGASGGGAVFIICETLNVVSGGTIDVDGSDGSSAMGYTAGSGSSGSILLHVKFINTNGAARLLSIATGSNYPGSAGRIAVYYRTITDAQGNPTPYTELINLPYFIEGTTSENAEIRVYNSSWVLESSKSVTTGIYQVEVGTEGPFFVVGTPTGSSKNSQIYRNITPSQ